METHTLTARHLMTSGIFLLHSWRGGREGEGGEAIKRELALTPLRGVRPARRQGLVVNREQPVTPAAAV